ncbi:hypothetical protein D3872_25105 [Massilia cavernae]|uniref:Proline racemase n=1 Tax=Massilia cavernae TaxID=2320864 RepID=A0A418X6Y8_9BURK|nr:hypothetical protein D3872_25105 [Massilia cavernae]
MQSITIIDSDSHTGGKPTRLVTDGGPALGNGPLSERLEILRRQHDRFRTAIACEPRGSEAMVGALLCPPHAPDCAAGVIFFNNVGYLGMCGHGAIASPASPRSASTAWRSGISPNAPAGKNLRAGSRGRLHCVPNCAAWPMPTPASAAAKTSATASCGSTATGAAPSCTHAAGWGRARAASAAAPPISSTTGAPIPCACRCRRRASTASLLHKASEFCPFHLQGEQHDRSKMGRGIPCSNDQV